MRKLIFFASIPIFCFLCWKLGLRVSISSLMLPVGIILGVMITICATLIATGAPKEVAAPPPTALLAPTRWRVVKESDVLVLPIAVQGRLGAGR